MAIDVKIPPVGESVTTGTIAQWHQSNGTFVRRGDVLLTLETDKVSSELEAEADGSLLILVEEGAEVEIGAVVATIDPKGASAKASGEAESEDSEPQEDSPTAKPAAMKVTVDEDAEEAGDEEGDTVESEPDADAESEATDESGDGIRVSPSVRKFAEKKDIDLTTISGTGRRGFITRANVESAISPSQTEESPAPKEKEELTVVTPAALPSGNPNFQEEASEDGERFTRQRMSPLRRKIASHLVQAQQQAAILTTFNECDMSAVIRLRKSLQEAFVAKHGIKLGFMSFFIKAVVDALRSVPQVNGRIDGEDLILNYYYDIGVAVGTERGLIVPVLRDCDRMSFAEIEQAITDYAAKAREGKIEFSDLQGGVFTISNGGIYGSMLSTPILNPPQSGILGMHNIQERPVAVDGAVVIRPMMYLALSYDHRIVDGKEAVTFLLRVKQCIEDPSRLLIEA